MLTVLQDEDGKQRENRGIREHAAAMAEIRRRDESVVPTESERVAHAQIRNRACNRGIDYAAIIKHRAIEPGLFVNLPTDDECRRALKIQNARTSG